jgi:type VI secretion system protein ImpM
MSSMSGSGSMSGGGHGSMSGDDGAGSSAGVYGKVRGQPDFLRANAGEFSQAGLDRWFQDAMEIIRNEKTALPAAPTAFLLAPAGSRSAFVGAFAPSTDAAGRLFPLVVFAHTPGARLPEALAGVTSTYAPFVETAGALALAGIDLPGPELIARVAALAADVPAAPSGGDGAGGGGGGGVPADATSIDSVVAALGGSRSALGYALRTLSTACDQAAAAGPDGKGGITTVDAPAPDAAARGLWLEIARRRLKWRDAAPSLLWTADDATGRLLMTLGRPSPAALSYLANPRHRSQRFWPLRTEVTTAIDQAMAALTPDQRRAVESPAATIGTLIAAFS